MSYVKDFLCHEFVLNGLQAEREATLSFFRAIIVMF